jgi:hypothetical protein
MQQHKDSLAADPPGPRSWFGMPCPYQNVWAGVFALLLFVVNVSIAGRLFGIEFTAPLHSPEGSFITLARVMLERPAENLWWPYWDAGMPFEHTYLPLLQWMIVLCAQMTGWSPASSYHAVVAFFYCLGPVLLFLMAWVMSRRPGASFVSGLLYSLISPSILLFPGIREDVGGLWDARRLHALVHYGAGPQVTALALLPAAILVLYLALECRRPLLDVAAGAAMAAVVLTNAFGAVTLALAVFCLLCARHETFWRDLRRTIAISVLAYLAICPWLPPSMLESIVFNAPTAGGDFPWASPAMLASLGLLAAFFVLWRVTHDRGTCYARFFLYFAFLLTTITTFGVAANLHVLPQAVRYHLEMEMALCLVLVFRLVPWVDRLTRMGKIVTLLLAAALAVWQWTNCRVYAQKLIQPADLGQTLEYQMARRMTELVGKRRVMVSGSSSMWFNVFSDTPQLSGGHEPTSPNWMQRVGVFIVYTGLNAGPQGGEIAVLWLKAFGVHGINVPGIGSREPSNPFDNPNKFEGLLPVLWRDANDTIYRVPQRSDSLVYVLPENATVTREPAHGLDVEEIRRYVAALEDPSLALPEVVWRNSQSAVIRTTIEPGQVLSVQVNHFPGWKATAGGVRQPTFRDGLGLLGIRPDCRGPCEIELVYDGGMEHVATRVAHFFAMIGTLCWLGVTAWRRFRS